MNYLEPYIQWIDKVKKLPEIEKIGHFREIISKDLFYILYFIMGVKVVNCKYGYTFAKEVQENTNNRNLWLCAREHLKSTTITIARTIQRLLINPESTTLILSYKSAIAIDFVKSIKTILETNELLKICFPDVIHKDSNRAKEWTQEKIRVKRHGTQKESTVAAGGLLTGMPTGVHYQNIIYDDIMTEDLALSMRKNTDVVKEIEGKFDLSLNLGTSYPPVNIDVVGTPYFHEDILNYIQKKGNYNVIKKPATHNGKKDGEPVFLTKEKLEELSLNPQKFRSQQLLDPTPVDELALNPMFIRQISRKDVDNKDVYRFMVIDPANSNKPTSDKWAISLYAVEPKLNQLGVSNVYLYDCLHDIIPREQAYQAVANMYTRNSARLLQVCVEEVGNASDSIHICNAVKAQGFYLSEDAGNLVILKPKGKSKEDRILTNVQAPLNRHCFYICTEIAEKYQESIREEFKGFPWSNNDDFLDTLAYLYEVIASYRNFTFQQNTRFFNKGHKPVYRQIGV